MYYVALDIGCIECDQKSHVLGIFKYKQDAQDVCDIMQALQEKNWHGQHNFIVESIKRIGWFYRVSYDSFKSERHIKWWDIR